MHSGLSHSDCASSDTFCDWVKMELKGSEWGLLSDSCDSSKESAGSIKGRGVLDMLSNCWFVVVWLIAQLVGVLCACEECEYRSRSYLLFKKAGVRQGHVLCIFCGTWNMIQMEQVFLAQLANEPTLNTWAGKYRVFVLFFSPYGS